MCEKVNNMLTYDTSGPEDDAAIARAWWVLRPSEYTALLIQTLTECASIIRGADVLEIGSGCGVVLAAMAALGAKSLTGSDIEPMACLVGRALADVANVSDRITLLAGDMFQPVEGRRFDVIVANLPHFPATGASLEGRMSTWSDGGDDGRQLLDRFIAGLKSHLTSRGRAITTHNGFVGLERTREVAAREGLEVRLLKTVWIVLDDARRARMNASTFAKEKGKSLQCIGPFTFAEIHVVEFSRITASG